MGSDEAGQLLRSEGWGASRAARAVGMTAADRRRVRSQWRLMALLWGLNPRGPDASAQAC